MNAGPRVLVADIGGTHARFALSDPGTGVPALARIRSFEAAGFPCLQDAVETYLDEARIRPRRAFFAVASPMTGDAIRLTNLDWSIDLDRLQAGLALDELRLINDFGAIARAVPWLSPAHRPVVVGPSEAPLRGPVSVLGPGTGLGVALLLGSDEAGWQVLETEGGHAGFAPVDEEEHAIARHLAATHGRVSIERVLSGPGLSMIDAVLRGIAGLPPAGAVPAPGDARFEEMALRDPAAIVDAALDGDDIPARRALERFCAIAGSVAGDIALVHGARSVVLAGGILPRIQPFLQASAFAERLRDKGRLAGWFDGLGVQLITHPHPGLLGAAIAAREDVT